jgi:UDP-N-acetylmuramoyl-tripeptide--D-alanyl-D-alanine ligase
MPEHGLHAIFGVFKIDAVVVEMAMRGFGQIAHLARFSRPTIGVVINIGHAHVEMVGSRAGIAEAKGELLLALPPTGTSVLWAEDDFLSELRKRAPGPVMTFGFDDSADSRILGYRPLSWYQAELSGVTQGVAWQATIPAVGRHIATGAAAAMLVASLADVPLDQAAIALATAELPPMRMEVRETNGVTLIMDNYNASPASMVAAIETLAEMPVSGRRRALIGAMRELGSETEDAHRQVGETLARNGIEDVIFFGEPMELAYAALGAGTIARSIDDVRMFLAHSQPGDAVLIKGSRALELERALQ